MKNISLVREKISNDIPIRLSCDDRTLLLSTDHHGYRPNDRQSALKPFAAASNDLTRRTNDKQDADANV